MNHIPHLITKIHISHIRVYLFHFDSNASFIRIRRISYSLLQIILICDSIQNVLYWTRTPIITKTNCFTILCLYCFYSRLIMLIVFFRWLFICNRSLLITIGYRSHCPGIGCNIMRPSLGFIYTNGIY